MNKLDKLYEKPILVYGAGAVARNIIPYLLQNEEMQVLGATVTGGDNSVIHTVKRDVPVKPLKEWGAFADYGLLHKP